MNRPNVNKAFLRLVAAIFTLAAVGIPNAFAQGDPEIIAKVIENGKARNQVMRLLEHICIQIGPRLTGSSNLQKACEWTRDMFASYGLNARLEQWGEIPVGFERGRNHVARMVEPTVREFQFTTRSWTAGTNGLVRAEAIMQPQTIEDVERMSDQIRGKWVITPTAQPTGGGGGNQEARRAMRAALANAGAVGTVTGSRNELVVTSGSWSGLTWENLPTNVDITVRNSDYTAITTALGQGQKVVLEFQVDQKFKPGPVPIYNVVADIVGTEYPDEYVIVSGHLDSWDGPGSQGAQDNAVGTMVALEAARLLMEAGAKPKRTIRFILWTGEEQGLFGSRAYVQQNGNILDKISAVFVDDGGTNYSGGLVCIPSMEEMLARAIEPLNAAFPDMPIRIRVQENMPRGGGSDHAPFNAVGVPGFFWTETGVSSYNYVHHTQHDVLPSVIERYLIQSSVAAAVTAYNLACADTLLPRQPRTPPPGN